ncbi:hypothetical protein GUITHDRAFT_116033 [Guillardia theta CCMP2712]|uniref:Uncharacterized protein n=2 Tax=Guillardia theta TaxID=55529 RepID=L1IN86_GUITC|nr:hypothetical protein GUITHDRAFT_116033 [Guillardia theta CCMP2712]EKX37728.1 hypothetical protein GUITHDRAFT_116033 [Guillardia theta CCMP2712]|eukprot:XP_005824708.1 hypothetical protein GUITHDRAFT_116033 [Guillardia theta CCMP2712]
MINVSEASPSMLAFLAIQRRINTTAASSPKSERRGAAMLNASTGSFRRKREREVSWGNDLACSVRVKRMRRFGRYENKVSSRRPRINKGLPRRIWSKVLHRTRCSHVDEESKVQCDKDPCFGIASDGQALWCKKHADPSHVDVRNVRCKFLGCEKHPVFGDAVSGMAKYCALHKKR